MPTVSIILSVFQSEFTLGRSLEAIRQQTYQDIEVIVVDSSPDDECQQIVTGQFPEFRYIHHPHRLSVDAARNMGFASAVGSLVVSTDPDCYSNISWLAELVAAHNRKGGLVFGGVACFGNSWVDLGAHLCKFDKWLSGGPPRIVPDGPSANMLISKDLVERASGFMGESHGDTDFSWRVRRLGSEIWLAPQAAVQHHHLHTWRSLLRERHQRGQEFGELWLSWHRISNAKLAWRLLRTVLPIRLASQIIRVGRNALRSGMFRAYVLSAPVVASGLYSWLLGEARAYSRLRGPAANE